MTISNNTNAAAIILISNLFFDLWPLELGLELSELVPELLESDLYVFEFGLEFIELVLELFERNGEPELSTLD